MKTSGYVIVIGALIVAIWDGIAVQFFGLEGSESYFFNRVGRAFPSFILCIGILIGHVFAPMYKRVMSTPAKPSSDTDNVNK